MKTERALGFLTGLFILGLPCIVLAVTDVGAVIAVKNKAVIERESKEIDAKVKEPVLSIDAISTREASRIKMLFRDDSVLTLGENSKVVIKEYIYSEGKRGKSVFNLIDGKMRSVVGNTEFEVHTPTTVAAARGTVIIFETGEVGGRKFTTILCVDGEVDVKNKDDEITGSTALTAGMMVTVFENEPVPAAIPAPASEVERLRSSTDTGYHEVSLPDPAEIEIGPAVIVVDQPQISEPPVNQQSPLVEQPPVAPPVDQQPLNSSAVKINIKFPE
ncbi:MAG: FecR domain-containing protein [Nitrospirae bacterium]|nr:FecR domain-containing protein [Nitrospirota bacterium]